MPEFYLIKHLITLNFGGTKIESASGKSSIGVVSISEKFKNRKLLKKTNK